MKPIASVLLVLIVLTGSATLSQSIQVTTADGGSVVTNLGYGIKLNEKSTLQRTWVILNDPSCPIQLNNAGVNTKYGDREYNYVPTGSAVASVTLTALEMRYLLYDVFGDHMKTLKLTQITDFAANVEMELKDMGSWRAWENDVSELLTVVAFVAYVRTSDGKVWRYQDQPISEELNKIRLQVTTGVLDPSKEER